MWFSRESGGTLYLFCLVSRFPLLGFIIGGTLYRIKDC